MTIDEGMANRVLRKLAINHNPCETGPRSRLVYCKFSSTVFCIFCRLRKCTIFHSYASVTSYFEEEKDKGRNYYFKCFSLLICSNDGIINSSTSIKTDMYTCMYTYAKPRVPRPLLKPCVVST